MAKGFKQATGSLDEEKSKGTLGSDIKAERAFEMSDAPKATTTDSRIKLGKGFSTASGMKFDDSKPSGEYVETERAYSIKDERDFNPERHFDVKLPKIKKEQSKLLLIAIVAVVVVCIAIVGMLALNRQKNSFVNPNPHGYLGATGSSEDTSDVSNDKKSDKNSVKAKDESDNVFCLFSANAHEYETQQVPLMGMKTEEKNGYDKTTISLPADMKGGDKNFVGSGNPSGVTFEWNSSHNKEHSAAGRGKSSITVTYGNVNDALKSYLSEFSKVYTEYTQTYVTTYNSSNSKPQEKKLTFKEMCQKSFDNIQQVLETTDNAAECEFTDNNIYFRQKATTSYEVKENYYYSDDVCAREMIIASPFHGTVEIRMLKAVNCGGSVRVMYSKFFNNSSFVNGNISKLNECDLRDLYQIEQTMKSF